VVLLWGTGGGLVSFEPVAVAFEADDVGVVDDPVDRCRGDAQVPEDIAPAGEREIGRQNHGRVFVAAGDTRTHVGSSCVPSPIGTRIYEESLRACRSRSQVTPNGTPGLTATV
jgi:hypothetical protein